MTDFDLEAPARYQGTAAYLQAINGRRFRKVDGTPLEAKVIPQFVGQHFPLYYIGAGDELLWFAKEVYGYTFYRRRGTDDVRYLGLGRQVLTEHQAYAGNLDALIDLGYLLTDPRPDVQPLLPVEQFLALKDRTAAELLAQAAAIDEENPGGAAFLRYLASQRPEASAPAPSVPVPPTLTAPGDVSPDATRPADEMTSEPEPTSTAAEESA